MNGDDLVHQARVIVGKPDTPTPIFSNEVRYILVNPIWRVPDSIIKKEMAPKLAQDPDYLTRRGFQVSRVGDRLVVRQPPGEGNALGHILFMFPNEHAVYLHDTPARGLFAGVSARFQPWLRARRAADAPGRTGDGRRKRGVDGRAPAIADGRDGADGVPAPRDPDPSRIFHRIRRWIRRACRIAKTYTGSRAASQAQLRRTSQD